jgi:hypothetical protein
MHHLAPPGHTPHTAYRGSALFLLSTLVLFHCVQCKSIPSIILVPTAMKAPIAVLLTLLALTSAQEAVRNNSNSDDKIPGRAAILDKLERTLDKKRQMVRDHESGHRRLSEDDFADVLRIISHQEFQIQKYMSLSDEDLRGGATSKSKQEAYIREKAERRRAKPHKNVPPKPERVPAESHAGLPGSDEMRRRKADEQRRAEEEQKAQRIEHMERLLHERQERLTAHMKGHRVLNIQQVKENEAFISKIKEKLEWTKNTPAEKLLARNSNNWNMQKRTSSGRSEHQTSTWKSSNLSFMEAMNAP